MFIEVLVIFFLFQTSSVSCMTVTVRHADGTGACSCITVAFPATKENIPRGKTARILYYPVLCGAALTISTAVEVPAACVTRPNGTRYGLEELRVRGAYIRRGWLGILVSYASLSLYAPVPAQKDDEFGRKIERSGYAQYSLFTALSKVIRCLFSELLLSPSVFALLEEKREEAM